MEAFDYEYKSLCFPECDGSVVLCDEEFKLVAVCKDSWDMRAMVDREVMSY